MKKIYPSLGCGILLAGLVIWGVRIACRDKGVEAEGGAVWNAPSRNPGNTSDVQSPRRDASRKSGPTESWSQFESFLANVSSNPDSTEGGDRAFLVDSVNWNRSQLAKALGQLMADGLEKPGRTEVFGALLYTFSEKDGEGALALYDQAREGSGFDKVLIHRLVLNLADQDPVKATQWVESHKDRLSPAVAGVMLEKIQQKAQR
ncbi:hypothetical protein KBB96_09075 [Luteolibacter ambystomatis]|uniref:Uncharacterized protein n=1 Tax=Luteolibacter ambystomatis TaxID=2824561 RepID=A0A975J2Y5_9BACT|nr:hypothetical protein [Luteolibacter ambystomatis]QUE53029.1 hypothetical protein KBB96_09075 [Luteolibacter ambystomatis]